MRKKINVIRGRFILPLFLTAALILTACGGGGGDAAGPVLPPGPQPGQPVSLDATLRGDQEVPPVVTNATGSGNLTVSADRNQIGFAVTLDGPFASAVTQAHIHNGAAGTNGPIALWFCTNSGNAPAGIPSPPACPAAFPATLTGTFTAANLDPGGGFATFAEAVNAMLTTGNTYINVHTVGNPGGEIRGQIGVAAVPPAVQPTADLFAWIGNTPLAIPAPGVLGNDPAGSAVASASATTSLGGSVTVNANGSFNYTPPAGVSGSDTFTYTVSGFPATTVTIQMDTVAWYVENTAAAGGNGSFGIRFNTLAAAAAASLPGDTIFVFTGDGSETGQNSGITLKANQKLIGEGVAFAFAGITIVPAGAAAPLISNVALAGALDTPSVTLANNNEVAGLQVTTLAVNGNEGILANAVTGFNIHDNSILNTAREGIRLLSVNGTGSISNNSFTETGREAISFVNNENVAGDPVAAVPIAATVSMVDNDISNPLNENQGINVDLGGATTVVTLTASGNTINLATDRGITVDSRDASSLTVVLFANSITDSTQEGIDMQSNDTSTIRARVDGNNLEGNGGVAQFLATAELAAGNFCLELTDNGNADLNATFLVDNNGTGLFQFFEFGNDTGAVRNGTITPVQQGTCAIP